MEFEKMSARKGLLRHLESLPWPHPHTVQVPLRNQNDDCFGLWMFQEGQLVEVPIPRIARFHQPAPPDEDHDPGPGMLLRADQNTALPEQTSEACRDTRSPWETEFDSSSWDVRAVDARLPSELRHHYPGADKL
ncbi:hypothetical protein ACWF2L_25895 [Streptomyces anulatus]